MRFREFIVRRAIYTVVTLIIVLVLIFIIFRIMPGDPVSMFIDPKATELQRRALIKQYGLDKPLWEQFAIYIKGVILGPFDFGVSFYTGNTVWEELKVRIGPTLLLFGSATIISWIIGIFLGMLMAWRRGSMGELAGIVLSLFFYTMPLFWFGLILIWLFAYSMGFFPIGGFVDPTLKGWEEIGSILHHLFLPLITLVIWGLAGHMLLMRNSMLEVLREDYVTTARAKGLSEKRIMYKHAARTAMLPVVTAMALGISFTVSGGVLTETIFSWPGVGRLLFVSTLQQDYPVVQGAFFFLALLTILANVIADILYAVLDPRVRL